MQCSAIDSEDNISNEDTTKDSPSEKEPMRLTHQQRVQLKETMAKMEVKMRIYKTIWYTRWRQIYQDQNTERVQRANKMSQQVKKLHVFKY